MPLLPPCFYAHLSPGVEEAFRRTHRIESHGLHYKMALRDASQPRGHRLLRGRSDWTMEDRNDLVRLYDESYPENWFDPRMLETRQYFGLRVDGRLVSVAGVHVYSEQYRVAAIGNVVTHPAHRNRGYGKARHRPTVPVAPGDRRTHRPEREGRQRAGAGLLQQAGLRDRRLLRGVHDREESMRSSRKESGHVFLARMSEFMPSSR